MDTAQKNITLGTAGHIDHGKTALIKLLTGCDTDLLKAEKERGMSIDLGFAPCTVAGLEVGIVDVPGHENFIKTMVAGATGIDGVIFVIAADDGVMPQTREHLDILTLLGVRHGIVALTKVDAVEPSRVQKAKTEVENFLIGTFLENAPILPMSSITGQGFDAFYEALKDLIDSIKPKKADGVFRLPVERTFSVKGYGTVVTGIPVASTIKVGDEVVLFPHGTKGRVKAVQVYKRNSDTATVGQCAAINVPQWDYKNIERGCTVTVGRYFAPEQWYLCRLQVLATVKSPLKTGANVRFHTGTSEALATAYLLETNRAAAGQEHLVQIRLDRPQQIVAAPRDRFILRSLSPVETIGGGTIVEALPKRLKRNQPHVVKDAHDRAEAVLTERDFVEYCIRTAEAYATAEGELSTRVKMLPGPLRQILAELVAEGRVLSLDSKLLMHRHTAGNLQQKIVGIVGDFHRARPESPGLSADQLYEEYSQKGTETQRDTRFSMLDSRKDGRAQRASSNEYQVSRIRDVFDGLVNLMKSQRRLVERKHRLALPEHRETFSDAEQSLVDKVETLFRNQPFNPPKFDEVVRSVAAKPQEVQKALKILIEQEQLIRVENDLYFHREAVDRARKLLTEYIKKEGGLESVKFKYLLDTTRKFAIPLLDYFDRIGVTRRAGYTRHLKTRS